MNCTGHVAQPFIFAFHYFLFWYHFVGIYTVLHFILHARIVMLAVLACYSRNAMAQERLLSALLVFNRRLHMLRRTEWMNECTHIRIATNIRVNMKQNKTEENTIFIFFFVLASRLAQFLDIHTSGSRFFASSILILLLLFCWFLIPLYKYAYYSYDATPNPMPKC